MTTIKYATVDVNRSELCTVRIVVPMWELPILRAVHGAARVNVISETTGDAEIPTPEAEYERLGRRYGCSRTKDGGLGAPYVNSVFGEYEVGVMTLERQMNAATVQKAA